MVKKLVAIRDPALSIPRERRLIHWGAAKKGKLIPGPADGYGSIGSYVYFSSIKQYARTYSRTPSGLSASKRRGGGLFVIDAKQLPAGARVLWPEQDQIGDRLFDLVDSLHYLSAWKNTLSCFKNLSIRQLITEHAEDLGVKQHIQSLTAALSNSNQQSVRCDERFSGDSAVVTEKTMALLDEAAYALALPTWKSIKSDNHSQNVQWVDQFNLPELFLIEQFGNLDLSLTQINEAIARYRQRWLTAFSQPVDSGNFDDYRNHAELAFSAVQQTRGSRMMEVNGSIVLIPGPIKVLPGRSQASISSRTRPERRGKESLPIGSRSTAN